MRLPALTLLLALCACAPEVSLREPVRYSAPSGVSYEARYGALKDGSLGFVKLRLPDGRTLTLPQVASASGARYTDERELVWWEHQGSVRVEVRGPDGAWVVRHEALKPD